MTLDRFANAMTGAAQGYTHLEAGEKALTCRAIAL
jgi:hypothetical protein